ncbi:MAG: NTP transferase domain-containing protein [Victivallales bacterium]|jgi:hypothetical protein|nr:NTP transferase domain-containing protein [Victivallales bacterium]
MKLTLLVLAAGMGSRYGGLKQLDEVGPSGETVMDYSVFDAIRAGFDRVVFVIRKDIEKEFRSVIGSRYSNQIEVDYAFQDLNDLPANFTAPAERTKPWGTAQAVYAARHLLAEPFAVINADDFYGEGSFRALAGYLRGNDQSAGIHGCIAAFTLANTLSENGSVSRGICSVDKQGNLTQIVENTKIFRRDGKIISVKADGSEFEFAGDELVSMNAWGFPARFVGELDRLFIQFLHAHINEPKSEFYLPFAVDTLIREHIAEIKVLSSNSNWFGVTYREDKPLVQTALRKLVLDGAYPERLFL